MSVSYFYLLFSVLTADAIMVFLTPVIVYMLTGSVELSGLSYAIWWIPRIVLIPLVGNFIDKMGVRFVSILTDFIRCLGCLFIISFDFDSPITISIVFGVVGSLVSIGNSQTIISYEKLISLFSGNKNNDVNLMSRIDFFSMVVGPIVGMILVDINYKILVFITFLLYFSNAMFFFFKVSLNEKEHVIENDRKSDSENGDKKKFKSLSFIFYTPVVLFLTFLSIGNNVFDGVVESAGTAIIDLNMDVPIKYFGFIDISAGLFGVLGTYFYGYVTDKLSRVLVFSFGLFFVVAFSILLIIKSDSVLLFVLFYGAGIFGKVIVGNISRLIRIEIIPINILASTSSLIMFFNQLSLPLVGLFLYVYGGGGNIYLLMALSVLVTLFSGLFVLKILVSLKPKLKLV